jgi:hypothetical protein
MTDESKAEWLLKCLRAYFNLGKAAPLEPLSDSDWEEVIQFSAAHGLTPLLYQGLRAAGWTGNVPAGVVGRLRRVYIENLGNNMLLYQAFARGGSFTGGAGRGDCVEGGAPGGRGLREYRPPDHV